MQQWAEKPVLSSFTFGAAHYILQVTILNRIKLEAGKK
jgi:hypothetical protein